MLIAACSAAAAMLCIIAFIISLSGERELRKLAGQQKEFNSLREEYAQVKERIEHVEKKTARTAAKGVALAMDGIFTSLGVKQKVLSVKLLSTREVNGLVEEEADIKVERANINETVNIFYAVEHAQMGLVLRRTTIKSSFENPALLDLAMTVALVRTK